MIATIDTPVSVWTAGLAQLLPAHSDPFVDLDPVDRQPLDVLLDRGQALGDPGGAQQLRERARVVGIEAQLRDARVGILGGVHEQVAPSGAMHEHTDAESPPT